VGILASRIASSMQNSGSLCIFIVGVFFSGQKGDGMIFLGRVP
jgi:hypothetical protein